MPSVTTQTRWSWLEDLARLEKLASACGVARNGLELSVWKEIEEACTMREESSTPDKNRGTVLSISLQETKVVKAQYLKDANKEPESHSSTSPRLPPIAITSTGQEQAQNVDVHTNSAHTNQGACTKFQNTTHLPSIADGPSSFTTNHHDDPSSAQSKSPDLQYADRKASEDGVRQNESQSRSETTEASVFHQLEQANYSDSETSDQSDGDTSDEEENSEPNSDDDVEPASKPNLPDLGPLSDLPWSSIIRYVYDSESMVSRYFSLQNKETVDKRTADAKALMNQETDASENGREKNTQHSVIEGSTAIEGSVAGDLIDGCGSEGTGTEGGEGEDSREKCHFCGKVMPRRSLLEDTENIEKIKEQDFICCEDYKNYTVLVAVCMRQMVERMRTAPPSIISVKPNTKVNKKRLMEEKALSMLRKKQKWEEIQRRRQLDAEARKRVPKGTKVIQFTLESPGEQSSGWIVRPIPQQTQAKKKAPKKKSINRKTEIFTAETLERLKLNALAPGELMMKKEYESGSVRSMILPDRTGYCNYPSGRKAVVIFSPYKGSLVYLVYEDSDFPQLLAYADELGRCCCYYKNGSIRFFSTPQLLLQLDASGHTRRRLKPSTPDTPPMFQPVSVPLGKHITLKCNQDSTSLLLTFPNDHIKFTMSSKLHKDETPSYSHELQSSTVAMETSLSQTKARIGQLLYLLQNISQLQKLSKLESLYGTPQSRGPKIQHPQDGDRKRTRSTGAIKAKKTVSSAEKHVKAMTSNLV